MIVPAPSPVVAHAASSNLSPGADRLTYVYLVSAAHSGSTLIACLLGANPEISTVGELGAVFKNDWDFRCSCGKTLGECCFWQSWRAAAESKGIDFRPGALGVNVLEPSFNSFWDRTYLHLFPRRILDRVRDWHFPRLTPPRRKADAAIDKSLRLVDLLCQMEGTNVFLDTTKAAQQVRLLAARPEIDFKFISLVRDGRGVMKSLMEKERLSPTAAIDSFLWSTKHRLRAESHVSPERLFRIRYLDLCTAPDEKIADICQFIGVAPNCAAAPALDKLHILGNVMRLKFDGTIRRDESWRNHLTKEHLHLFEARAGRVNRSLGYLD